MTLALAMSMLIVSSAVSFAGATTQHTITITTEDKVGDHTYEAYQVFKGDYANGKLSNISWGTGVDGDAILNAVKADTTTFGAAAANAATAEDVAALLGTAADNPQAKKFAAIVGEHLATVAGTSTTGDTGTTISVTGDGYYFVKDKAGTLPTDNDGAAEHKGDAETRYILQVVGDVTVGAKSNTVKSEKKVDDVNDSTGEAVTLKDSADYDIGDTIPYTLTFTLPSNYADYTTYAATFVDDMSKGLTYNRDAKIYYGATDKTGADITFTQDTSATSSYTGGKVYKASVANLKTAAPNLVAGDVITIKYTATLNNDAVIGEAGNPNKYHVDYSNNPNGTGTGHTPDDVNIVFTYDIEVDKVTGTGNAKTALGNAGFALYKLYATVPAGKTAVTSIKYDNGSKDYTIAEGENWVLVEQKQPGANVSEFTFSGVDDGTYLLVETATPAGYNSIEPAKFTVTATHNDGDTPSFGSVTGAAAEGSTITLGPLTRDSKTVGLKTEIVNNEGSVLPSTGGIGTIIFYVLGSLLVVGCGIVLISKRRMESR